MDDKNDVEMAIKYFEKSIRKAKGWKSWFITPEQRKELDKAIAYCSLAITALRNQSQAEGQVEAIKKALHQKSENDLSVTELVDVLLEINEIVEGNAV